MSLAASIRKLVPVAIKRPLRNYIDNRTWRQQPRLPFSGDDLKSRSKINLASVMEDTAIGAAYADDQAKIERLYGSGEIFGGVNPGDRRALYHLIAHFGPKRVLEIGTHVGASTVYIASALKRFVEGGKFTTADIVNVNGPDGAWRSLGLAVSPASFIAKLGLGEITSFVTRPAAEMLQTEDRFDLVFLDGDHSAPAVYREISAALKILNPAGLILLHDFYPGGMPLTPDGSAIAGPSMAADRINAEASDIAFVPVGVLPWLTKGGGRATSLALVARRD